MSNKDPITKDEERFECWTAVVQNMGPIFVIWERIFYVLGTLSLLTLIFRLARHVYGLAEPKLHAIRYDAILLIYFALFGVCLPLVISIFDLVLQPLLAFIGVYIVLYVIQHQGNVILFDQFRANRLSKPRKWIKSKKLEQAFERMVFPLAQIPRESMQRYVRTGSGSRRLLLALMDYWLLLVAYAFIYWSSAPLTGWPKLKNFYDAIYFSVVAGTTLGFGDILPKETVPKLVTISETLVSFLFALVIIAHTVTLVPRAPTLENDV